MHTCTRNATERSEATWRVLGSCARGITSRIAWHASLRAGSDAVLTPCLSLPLLYDSGILPATTTEHAVQPSCTLARPKACQKQAHNMSGGDRSDQAARLVREAWEVYRVTNLDGAVGLAGLPVPEPQLALPIPAQHIAPIWRECWLTSIPSYHVPLHCTSYAKHKQRKLSSHGHTSLRLMAHCDADAMTGGIQVQDICLPSNDWSES